MNVVEKNIVEDIAAAIVREYLHGKGCQRTLLCIDTEMARTDDSISSRSLLAKLLHIEKLLKKNKDENTFQTMLEVLIKYYLSRSKSKAESTPRPSSGKTASGLAGAGKGKARNLEKKSQPVEKIQTPVIVPDSVPLAIVENDEKKDEDWAEKLNPAIAAFSEEFKSTIHLMQKSTVDKPKRSTVKVARRPLPASKSELKSSSSIDKIVILQESSRTLSEMLEKESHNSEPDGLNLPKDESLLPGTGKYELNEGTVTKFSAEDTSVIAMQENERVVPTVLNNPSVTKRTGRQHRIPSGPIARGGLQSDRNKRTSAAKENFLFGAVNQPVKLDLTSHTDQVSIAPAVTSPARMEKDETAEQSESPDREEVPEQEVEKEMGNWLANEPSTPHLLKKKMNLRLTLVSKFEDLKIGDLDEFDESNSGVLVSPDPSYVWLTLPQGTPIEYEMAVELKTLVLGSVKKGFPEEWNIQNFCFSTNPKLTYGIVQKKGGPCGVLACVQAYLIKELMFIKSWKNSIKSDFSEEECKKCLALALAQILWKTGSCKKAVIAMPTNRTITGLSSIHDGLIEKINLLQFTDLAALQSFINRHVAWYTEDNKYSCITFLYSAILSRGLDRVKSDMDDPKSCLIGTHGYCSQEVVNLLLTGRASSNVFDNVITLDDGKESRSVLKGVTRRSEVGFLALFEHYNSCQVGTFLKCPRYPIWVICSESHFSVLFAKDTAVCDNNANGLNKFDLYYYDGLLHHEDEIKLTISLSNIHSEAYPNDLIPPLDLCIRTKWKDAHVDWNGTEPLL